MAKGICSVDDCPKNVLARGLCVTHYHRWHRTVHPTGVDSRPCDGCGEPVYRTVSVAPIRHYCSPACRPRCSVEGCEKVRHGDVYCTEHHTRWKRTGDPLTPLERQHNVGTCSVEGCDQPMRKAGWCSDHYSHARRHGDVLTPFAYKWGSGGYFSTHAWLGRLLGPAADRTCIECNGPAAEWSYDHNDPNERIDSRGCAYSRDPKCYSPRCALCHRRMDRAIRRNKP